MKLIFSPPGGEKVSVILGVLAVQYKPREKILLINCPIQRKQK